ncbi:MULTISPECIES: molybdopterin-dependent oxidoreductase [Microbacterium]|uniref:molybdopterin-dependent oxidoreductase n=1 Tax=Microbacterium TaxID=33882 RepID=UPI00277EAEAF|nr:MULTISPECIES: molybdopterin-dependent oxidoreductase [Microbacterium]MDQ1084732.1 DMSO/TMAO reductase YedYZ molybdopterin-dependent catalytic subunit [Microbacterium sp. SORGH_AS_0344]MDQ1169991.1 DMSO/TMAO reductase YedYZ molybdopterin-dependent catalytic subunit [Microbacterium proteolyticum]
MTTDTAARTTEAPTVRRPHAWPWAAFAGIVAAAVLLAVAEMFAALVARSASPVLAVGSFIVDIVPRPLKELAITLFGESDKIALLVGVGLGAAVASAVAGILEYRFRFVGAVLIGIGGILATAAILTRAGAGALAWLPPVLGTVVGIVVLLLSISRLRRWIRAASARDAHKAGANRRQFLLLTGLTAVGAVVVGVGARVLNATTASVAAARDALRLPAARTTVTVPAGADLDIDGLTPIITPNGDFYRVDTALTVPNVDPTTWRLSIEGMVDTPIELSFDDLVGMGLDEYGVTLTCVSNEVGGGLVGNAIWTGVPIRDVLRMAGVQADADMVLSESVDGYTASTPLSSLTDDNLDAIFAVAMNGEPLPFEHGFPVRMVVPGLYGYVSATKWVTKLTVTRFDQDEAYWTPRGYSAEAPIKMSSRVDTPKLGTPVTAGTVVIAGMAWAQPVGVQKVEVSIDDGDWQETQLSTPINDQSWVQWRLDWNAEPGSHYIAVRATDKQGNLQIQDQAPIAPDGSSGWQRTLVTVSS